MPHIVKKKVVYFSVVVEPDEDENEVIENCYYDLKHGQSGLDYSHTDIADFEEMTDEEVRALFGED